MYICHHFDVPQFTILTAYKIYHNQNNQFIVFTLSAALKATMLCCTKKYYHMVMESGLVKDINGKEKET